MGKFKMNSTFYCTQCGNRGLPIIRRTGSEREAGHLKKLYCLNCKKETNHAECKDFTHYTEEDFFFEFENNNFDQNGKRILPYGLFRDKMNKEGVVLP